MHHSNKNADDASVAHAHYDDLLHFYLFSALLSFNSQKNVLEWRTKDIFLGK